ncbi:TIGR02588 family protein [soil metagenome]
MTTRRALTKPERVTFAIAVSILLALGGSILWLWSQPREPAIVTVEPVGERRVAGGQSYVTARVRNAGDQTAEAVQVVAALTRGGEVVAEGEQSTDFLSGGEVEDVVFLFDVTARDARVDLRVASYRIP